MTQFHHGYPKNHLNELMVSIANNAAFLLEIFDSESLDITVTAQSDYGDADANALEIVIDNLRRSLAELSRIN